MGKPRRSIVCSKNFMDCIWIMICNETKFSMLILGSEITKKEEKVSASSCKINSLLTFHETRDKKIRYFVIINQSQKGFCHRFLIQDVLVRELPLHVNPVKEILSSNQNQSLWMLMRLNLFGVKRLTSVQFGKQNNFCGR